MSGHTPPPGAHGPDSASADPDVAAAELALGVLDGGERAVALRRVLADPNFARAVETWRAYFAQLFDLWPEMAPSGAVLERLDRTIDAPVGDPTTAPRRASLLWPAIAAVTSLIAASLLFVVLLRPAPVAPPAKPVVAAARPEILVAAIDAEKAGGPVAAVYDPGTGGLRLTEARMAQAHQSAELWIIGADATPHSLGLLRTDGTTVLRVSPVNRAQLAAGATLAISLEAVGGSPTGLPQGPVVAKGTLSRV